MARILITQDDFELQIFCNSFDDIRTKALKNIGEDALWANYIIPDEARAVFYRSDSDEDNGFSPLTNQAFFFDNVDYCLSLKITNSEACQPEPAFTSKSAAGRLQRSDSKTLIGTLNFGNDIGKFELAFTYKKLGIKKRICLTIEILSQKIDYHRDWITLIKEIEEEHQTLAFDILKSTYHSFDIATNDIPKEQKTDIIWWYIFKTFQDQFIKASNLILRRPHHKWKRLETYLRADQLRSLSPAQENEFAENRLNPAHLYYSEKTINDHDTPENRFFKMAVKQISDKYMHLSHFFLEKKAVKENGSVIDKIQDMRKRLVKLKNNVFFRGVGKFNGLKQESLILQRASGYSVVYRIWAMLKMMYALNGNRINLESKDIATLYEMWCFIRIKNALSLLTNGAKKAKAHLNNLAYNLFTGENSQLIFKDSSGVELAEIRYNSSSNANLKKQDDDMTVPTASIPPNPSSERPDIVLRLSKAFGGDSQYKVTYLFDAKYRIQDTYSNGVDYPPQDAINQMHRYRDAIYYRKRDADERLKKEIVGGYILFPGKGNPEAVKRAPFMRTREEVNIGAFPLRPGDEENAKILQDFLNSLLNESEWARHLENVIAQKGMEQIPNMAELTDRILIVKNYPVGYGTAVRQKGILPWGASSCNYPEKVELIVLPIAQDACVFKVKAPLSTAMWSEVVQSHPEFSSFNPQFESYYIWSVEELKNT